MAISPLPCVLLAYCCPFHCCGASPSALWLGTAVWYGIVHLSCGGWTSAKGFPRHHGKDASCQVPSNHNKQHLYNRQRGKYPLPFLYPPPSPQIEESLTSLFFIFKDCLLRQTNAIVNTVICFCTTVCVFCIKKGRVNRDTSFVINLKSLSVCSLLYSNNNVLSSVSLQKKNH